MNGGALLLVLAVGGFLFLLFVLLAGGQALVARRIRTAYARTSGQEPVLWEPNARFLGLASGAPVPAGQGVFVLSPTEVYFERYSPAAGWRLDLERVLKLEMVEEYLGHRRPGRRLLVLVYHNEAGKAERAGFRVVHVDRWTRLIGHHARIRKGLAAPAPDSSCAPPVADRARA